MQIIVTAFLAMLGLLAEFTPALAADDAPVQGPMLRIEAGMHTGVVMRIDLSADGKLMVTGASDKTVRLWSLPDGKLLRTLRVPISPDNGGKVHAVRDLAGRPPHRRGRLGRPSHSQLSSSMFDSATGKLVRRLGPLAPSIGELAFSPDGSRLAVGLMGKGGVRVWTAPFDGEPFEDGPYVEEGQGAVYSLAFDAKNRLVTTSEDFYVRLYDDQLQPIAKVKPLGDNEPKGIAFNPDGTLIAVGHYTASQVDILDGKTLDPLYAADTAEAKNGALAAVAWSSDGATLYAGGSFDIEGTSPIVTWGGSGARTNAGPARPAQHHRGPHDGAGRRRCLRRRRSGLRHHQAGRQPDAIAERPGGLSRHRSRRTCAPSARAASGARPMRAACGSGLRSGAGNPGASM